MIPNKYINKIKKLLYEGGSFESAFEKEQITFFKGPRIISKILITFFPKSVVYNRITKKIALSKSFNNFCEIYLWKNASKDLKEILNVDNLKYIFALALYYKDRVQYELEL